MCYRTDPLEIRGGFRGFSRKTRVFRRKSHREAITKLRIGGMGFLQAAVYALDRACAAANMFRVTRRSACDRSCLGVQPLTLLLRQQRRDLFIDPRVIPVEDLCGLRGQICGINERRVERHQGQGLKAQESPVAVFRRFDDFEDRFDPDPVPCLR